MSDRFIVKKASEMREGEPCAAFTAFRDDAPDICAEMNANGSPGVFTFPERWDHQWAHSAVPVVDTYSPDWEAFDAKNRNQAEAPPLELTAEDVDPWKDRNAARAKLKAEKWEADHLFGYKNQPPTIERLADAEIVKAWDEALREHEGGRPGPYTHGTEWTAQRKLAAVFVGPKASLVRISGEAHQAARSRELKRKQAEAREADRHRVICEDQYEL